MFSLKKIIFAPIFLILFAFLSFQITPFLKNSLNIIFSLNLADLWQVIAFCLLLIFSAIFFALFVTFSQNPKIDLPILGVAALIHLIFQPNVKGLILAAGSFGAFFFVYALLSQGLKNYLTFSPSKVLGPQIKLLVMFLIFFISLTSFFISRDQISKNGFSLPDSLIDTALKIGTTASQTEVKGAKYLAQGATLTEDQIQLLKQHPELLQQYNLTPQMLDSFSKPTASSKATAISPKSNLSATAPSDNNFELATSDLAKNLIKDQLNKVVSPYLPYIPYLLAFLLFISLYSFSSLLMILLPVVLWGIFEILESSHFVHFEKEMREVKKLVV